MAAKASSFCNELRQKFTISQLYGLDRFPNSDGASSRDDRQCQHVDLRWQSRSSTLALGTIQPLEGGLDERL